MGFFSGQLHFLPRVWPVRPRAKQGRDRLSPPLSLLWPRLLSALVRFQCETFPKLCCLAGFWYLSWTQANSNWEQIAAFVGPSGPRRPQFRLICEVTPLENANSATVDRETRTINFLRETGTTKFPIPTLTCRHTQVTNGGFMGK